MLHRESSCNCTSVHAGPPAHQTQPEQRPRWQPRQPQCNSSLRCKAHKAVNAHTVQSPHWSQYNSMPVCFARLSFAEKLATWCGPLFCAYGAVQAQTLSPKGRKKGKVSLRSCPFNRRTTKRSQHPQTAYHLTQALHCMADVHGCVEGQLLQHDRLTVVAVTNSAEPPHP